MKAMKYIFGKGVILLMTLSVFCLKADGRFAFLQKYC